ncbi:TolC family protein [Arsukibacterium sp.]|uniref:TolC family protein n=1 Tax=Arsukibacterium sp. TaxID=1977258 RepID=UPI003569AEE1
MMSIPLKKRANTSVVKLAAITTLLASLTACAVNPGDPITMVQADIAAINPTQLQRIEDDAQQQQIRQQVQALLLQPLTLDIAVEVAVLNNKTLQAELFALGVSAAQLQQASQLPNPAIMLTRNVSDGNYATELEFGFNILLLLTLPKVRQLETNLFAQARLTSAQRIASIIADTRYAYFNAVAAQEVLHYIEQVYTTTEAGAELAKRMLQSGNFSKLDYLREQALLTEATLNLVKARQLAYSSKETLKQQLGLWQESEHFNLPHRLPEVPAQLTEWRSVVQGGLDQRLDIRLAKLKLAFIAQSAGLTNATRFINAFELEVGGNLQDSSERSYKAVLELPLFDWGSYRVKKAEYQYQQAFNDAFAAGVKARSELRTSYHDYASGHELALHYKNAMLPIQQQIAEENQLRYNGMFISVFELIADARNQINAVTGYVNATRDFWLAKSQLDMVMMGVSVTKPESTELQSVSVATGAGH